MMNTNERLPVLNDEITALMDDFIVRHQVPQDKQKEIIDKIDREYWNYINSDFQDCSKEEKDKLLLVWYKADKNRIYDSEKFISDDFLKYIKEKF